MRSIERRFRVITDKEPLLSSFCIFARAVKGQRFSQATISNWFKELVDEDDYQRSDTQELIDYLVELSNSEGETCEC